MSPAHSRLLHQDVRIDLYGNGRVATALLPLLAKSRLELGSIHDSRGIRHEGTRGGRRVLVDCTPPRYEGVAAEQWTSFLEGRLQAGIPVVTCNKAPFALAWQRLQSAAAEGGSCVRLSATVGGGTPLLPFLHRIKASQDVHRVEASLSGTLSHVAARVQAGDALALAVTDAQRRGFAEPDPRLDLDGTDARAKGVIVHNSLWPGHPLALADAGPPLHLDEESLRGPNARPIVTVAPGSVACRVQEAPWLAGEAPGSATLRVHAGGSTFLVQGPGAGPEATAANLLADLVGLWP